MSWLTPIIEYLHHRERRKDEEHELNTLKAGLSTDPTEMYVANKKRIDYLTKKNAPMYNLYDISRGQLITLWVFGLIFFVAVANRADATDASVFVLFLAVFVPFSLVFYTLGWRNKNKKE